MKKAISVLLSIILILSAFAVSGVAEEADECEHMYWHYVIPASCNADGMEYDLCLNCGETANHTVIPKGHKFTHVVEDSTCTAEGAEYDLCSVCNERANEAVIPVKEHSWGKWILTAEPTAENDGIEERECAVCHNKDTRAVDKLKTLSDEKTGISVVCGDAFPKDVELIITPTTTDKKPYFDFSLGQNKFLTYEISAFSGGVKVQPSKPVTLMLEKSVFNCAIGSLLIFHFPETGARETFSITRSDAAYLITESTLNGKDYYCITVSSFSPFIIADATGDINDDGKINSTDALLALMHSAGMNELSQYGTDRADVNRDETVDSSDALEILQYSAGLREDF